jgi:Cof subfamily protein (haloacid dehalogenase superfamily)
MSFEKKVLFTDLDDTLLTRSKELTPANASAIRRALDSGHKIVASTGRPLASTLPLLKKIHLDGEGCYVITYNGGMITDLYHQKNLYKKTLPLPVVRHIFKEAAAYGIYCQTYSDTSLLCKSYTEETALYYGRTPMPWQEDPALPDSLTQEPVKVLTIHLGGKAKQEAYHQAIAAWGKGQISTFYSNDYFLEHVACGISKGAAIEFLCRHLQIPMEQTLAIGDAENDIPMLQRAHTGIAVANADPAVKDAADYVTTADCDNSALAEAIEKFMLL